MNRVAELMGHTERVLGLCLSPDTSTLVSAGADETLRFVMMDVCYNAKGSPQIFGFSWDFIG